MWTELITRRFQTRFVIESKGLRRVETMLAQLVAEIGFCDHRSAFNGVAYHSRERVKVDGHLECQPRIEVNHLRSVSRRIAKCPVLFLDATGSAFLNSLIFQRHVVEHVFHCERKARIVQVRRKTFSRQSLTGVGSDRQALSETKMRDANRPRAEVIQLIQRVVLVHGPVAVFCSKDVECQVEPYLPEGSAIGHFGKLRGLNRWEKYRAVIVLGRDQASLPDLERRPALLWRTVRKSFRHSSMGRKSSPAIFGWNDSTKCRTEATSVS